MATFDKEAFWDDIEDRLRALDDPQRSVVFAVRVALMVLPLLGEKGDKQALTFLWFWQEDIRGQYILAIFHALQRASFSSFDRAAYDAAAYDVANAVIDAADAATAANAGNAAAAAYATANAANAANAGNAAAYATASAVTNAVTIANVIIPPIQKEMDTLLLSNLDSISCLSSAIPIPSRLLALKTSFLSDLRAMPGDFDYWADWLQDRYEGKPINSELLKKSVLLPDEIKAQSPAEINLYLKKLRDGVLGEKIKRVRAIFIGNGEAGKTSLIQALNGKEVKEKSTDMTAGIEISEWPVAGTDLSAHFWDFGGQVIAHATHQFFLRSRCVYVLVINARGSDSNPNQQAEYWLQFVRAFGADAPVLLVGNKCDLTPVLLDAHRLREEYPNIQGCFSVSATEYQGSHAREFELFTTSFCQQLSKVGEVQPSFSRDDFALIEVLREKSKKNPFLKKVTFKRLCATHNIAKERRESLLDLLDKLGEIIYFPELAWLDEFLLNPRWLTYGVYQLLYSKLLKQQHGCIRRANVVEILKGHSVKDNDGHILKYPEEKQHLLIEVMREFKLCYPSLEAKDTWVVPDLLSSDQPENLDFDNAGALCFDFDFSCFLPRHLLNMFIVEHYRDIHHNLVWQHGVHLFSKTWQTQALVRANYQRNILSLEVTGNLVDRYFSVLYDSVIKLLHRMSKLEYTGKLYLDENARMAKEKGFNARLTKRPYANFDTLLAQQAAGQREYICEFGTYNLTLLLKLMPKPNLPSEPFPLVEKPPHKNNNPWISGLFFLFTFVVVITALGIALSFVNAWLVPPLIIGAVAATGVIGALQLRNDEKLKQQKFVTLMMEFYKRLFLLRKIMKKPD